MVHKTIEEITGYLELGLWQDANDLIEELPPEAKTLPAVLALRVRIYREAGSWELMAAVSLYLAGVEPDNAVHWLNYAQATLYIEGIPPSLAILEQAAQRLPESAEVLYTLACRKSEMGRLEEAKEHLGAAICLNPRLRQKALDDPELNALWDGFRG